MERKTYPALDETVYRGTLPNGLTVAIVPRPGFTKKLAYFVADYGSIHTEFTLDGQPCTAPEGTAHFLEHKLFDMPGRDITAEFAALGASPNAFTSYDMTAYYFSCTDHFPENLRLLLEFVSTPYFTEETVQKEQGIIGQEIAMNDDSPDSRIFENLAAAMYRSHPAKNSIAGTAESIGRITAQTLRDSHRVFYSLSNMLLCIVGDVDPEQVRQIALEVLPQTDTAQVTAPRSWQEDMTCPQSYISQQMEVSMPMFQIGFKAEPLGRGRDAIRQEFIGELAAEALFGESSPLYLRMYEEGLIDSSFGGDLETIEGMCMLTASGDSDRPEAVRQAILDHAQTLCREGITQADFLRMKRSAMGRRIRGLDSFDSTCFRVCAYHLSGFDYFDFPAVYEQIRAEELLDFIQRVVTPERCCLSVIEPLQTPHKEESEC